MLYSVSPRVKLSDRRIEAELKLQHADADALGGEEMAELVHEHEHAEHEHEGKKRQSLCRTSTSDFQF